jgi:hypothetical protein
MHVHMRGRESWELGRRKGAARLSAPSPPRRAAARTIAWAQRPMLDDYAHAMADQNSQCVGNNRGEAPMPSLKLPSGCRTTLRGACAPRAHGACSVAAYHHWLHLPTLAECKGTGVYYNTTKDSCSECQYLSSRACFVQRQHAQQS